MASKNKKPLNAQKSLINSAIAPYNFVSLPKNSVAAPFAQGLEMEWAGLKDEEKQKIYADYVAREGKNNGFLEITIETLTPCFVNTAEKPGENADDAKAFFSVGENYLIAGSSLRGMVKNIFKIISGGAMRPDEDLEDKHLYFRSIAGKKDNVSPLRQSYGEEIDEAGGGPEPGFLLRTVGDDYFICPAEGYEIDANGNNEYLSGLRVHWGTKEELAADLVSGPIPTKKKYIHISNTNLN